MTLVGRQPFLSRTLTTLSHVEGFLSPVYLSLPLVYLADPTARHLLRGMECGACPERREPSAAIDNVMSVQSGPRAEREGSRRIAVAPHLSLSRTLVAGPVPEGRDWRWIGPIGEMSHLRRDRLKDSELKNRGPLKLFSC